MKKFSVLFLCICMFIMPCFTACDANKSEDDDLNYDDGYYDGYYEGFLDGQQALANIADDGFQTVCYDTDIEKALTILILSTDGETYTKKQIEDAIWTVQKFYDDTQQFIYSLDSYRGY